MALSTIPPWLNVGPTDYLRAIQAGTATGLQVAEAQNRAQEAAARRAMAQQESQQRAWEFGERMRLAAEENARQGEYQQGMLDWRRQQVQQDMARAAQGDQLAQARLAETSRHNLATEAISQAHAEALARRGEASIVEHPEAPGMKFLRNPSGAETPIIRPEREMGVGQKAALTLSGLRQLQMGPSEDPFSPAYQTRTNYVGRLLNSLGTLPNPQPSTNEAPAFNLFEQIQVPNVGGAQIPSVAPFSFTAPQQGTNEVIRVTKDGRKAVFNADTKEFIRYAE